MSFLSHCDRIPPYVVRRMARRNGEWMRAEDIAQRAGLSIPTIMRYSRMKSWASIPVARAEAFATACGHDLLRPSASVKYLTKAARTGKGFSHLPTYARKQFSKLLKRYG